MNPFLQTPFLSRHPLTKSGPEWVWIWNLEMFKKRDDINNFILTYAISWRNLPLIEYIFKNFCYDDINKTERDFIRDLTKEIFLVIRRLSKKIKRNGEFIFNLLNIIEASSFRPMLVEIAKQPDIYFYFERKKIHLFLLM